MNLRHLRYFCAACETRSTVAAARQCHVTQPVISTAIAQLEEELGTPLFTRQPRGLQPTAEGLRLYRLGGRLLADAQAIVESFQDAGSRPRVSLRLHAALGLGQVGQLLRHLKRELPQLELDLLTDEARGDGAPPADAALTAEACRAPGDSFLPLWDEQYVLAVPPGHPLAVKAQVSLGDLHHAAFIDRAHCELAAQWHAGLGALQIVPDVRARVHSEEWALGLVAAGIGVTIVPLHRAAGSEGVVLRRDLPELQSFTRRVGLAYPGPARGALAEVLRACKGWKPLARPALA